MVIHKNHFIECTNGKCKSIYPIKLSEIKKDSDLFCPKCELDMQESHVVQCKNCQSILNFIPKFPNEEAIIYYVKKCLSCSGTLKDEKLLIPHYFPESFI